MGGFRRNDYIASIRYDISEIDTELGLYPALRRQQVELIQQCKEAKRFRFGLVCKRELRLMDTRHKWLTNYRKKLVKLLARAEKHAPGGAPE